MILVLLLSAAQVSAATAERTDEVPVVSVAANRSTPGDRYELTPPELQLAKERRRNLEEARNANADARHVARQAEDDAASMAAEAVDMGLLLTFDDDAFASYTELSAVTRQRLDALVSFLRRNPDNALRLGAPRADASEADVQTVVARSGSLKRYLARAGIGGDRLMPASLAVATEPAGRTAVQLVIEDSNISR